VALEGTSIVSADHTNLESFVHKLTIEMIHAFRLRESRSISQVNIGAHITESFAAKIVDSVTPSFMASEDLIQFCFNDDAIFPVSPDITPKEWY
jgi:hypothetical protein